jgi:hypothetical protein
VAEALAGTVLERGRIVPGAALRDARTGREVGAWSLRGRSALVIAFVHAGCERCASFVGELEDREEEIRTAGGRLLAVDDGSRAMWLGADPELPVVLVVDRDGAAWRSYPAAGHLFPDPEEVTATLWHLATMCPECGVPTPGWED